MRIPPAALALVAVAAMGVAAVPAGAAGPTTLWRAFPLDPRHPTATGAVAAPPPAAARPPAPDAGGGGDGTPWALVAAGAAAGAIALGAGTLLAIRRRRRADTPRPPAHPTAAVAAPPGPVAELAGVAAPAAGPPAGPASAPAAPPPAPAPGPRTATIRWRPDPDLCHFYAEDDDAPGAALARSPDFRWRSAHPPPRRAAIVAAHATLLEELHDGGWVLDDAGEASGEPYRRWYESCLALPAAAGTG